MRLCVYLNISLVKKTELVDSYVFLIIIYVWYEISRRERFFGTADISRMFLPNLDQLQYRSFLKNFTCYEKSQICVEGLCLRCTLKFHSINASNSNLQAVVLLISLKICEPKKIQSCSKLFKGVPNKRFSRNLNKIFE